MREIKFRCFDKLEEAMHKVVSLNTKLGIVMYQDDDEFDVEYCDINDCPIMQYTGLHDKNGVEIYEGDIVIRCNEIIEVKWVGGDDEDYQGFNLEQVFGKWEIIGNIYEYPELLESKK